MESYEMSKCQNCGELWRSLVNQVKSLQTKKLISKSERKWISSSATVTNRGTTADQPGLKHRQRKKTKTKTKKKDKDKDKDKDKRQDKDRNILQGQRDG